MKKIAIVTGASSGFGTEFVKIFAKDSTVDEIWMIARRKELMEQVAAEIEKTVKVFCADLSNMEEIQKIGENLKQAKVTVHFLVNNAGYGKFGSYSDVTPEESVNMIQLNCGSVVIMGLICIPYMERGSRIINIASQSAFQPLPYLNVYSASKVFVRNYTRSLNQELKSKGITATAVCPGWIADHQRFQDVCRHPGAVRKDDRWRSSRCRYAPPTGHAGG